MTLVMKQHTTRLKEEHNMNFLASLNLGEVVIWVGVGVALGLGFRKAIMKWTTGEWK